MPTSRGRSARLASALPAWPVQAVLGLVLIAAGTATLYRHVLEVGGERLMLIPVVLAEAEVIGGIGMVSGLTPFVTRRLGLALFGGLGAANLLSALAGRCTGGGLGSTGAWPWSLALFAAVASGALLTSRPRDASGPSATPGYPELVALGLAGVLAVLAGWHEGGLVTVTGTATHDGAPLVGATLVLTGNSGEIVLETDHGGHFRCPLVRPGTYAVSVRGTARPRGANVEARVLAPSWVTVGPCPGEGAKVSFRSSSRRPVPYRRPRSRHRRGGNRSDVPDVAPRHRHARLPWRLRLGHRRSRRPRPAARGAPARARSGGWAGAHEDNRASKSSG